MLIATQGSIFTSQLAEFLIPFQKNSIQAHHGKNRKDTHKTLQVFSEQFRSSLTRFITSPFDFLAHYNCRWTHIVISAAFVGSSLTDHSLLMADALRPLTKLVALRDRMKNFKLAQPRLFLATTLGIVGFRSVVGSAASNSLPKMEGFLREKINMSQKVSGNVTQLGVSLFVQLLMTPLQLLAFDYCSKTGVKWEERLKKLRKRFSSAVGMRMMKCIPLYGAGGIITYGLQKNIQY